MKRIILSKEEKEKYEKIGVELQRRALFVKRRTKPKTCPVCRTRYQSGAARDGNHVGYCSLTCSNGRTNSGIRKKGKKKKQRLRQLRRIEKTLHPPDFYNSDAWRELRYKILRKFGFKCMACGASPPKVVLHVDHIKPRSKYPGMELDPNNLQVLCASCNLGKRHHFEDDLRPK